MSAAKGWRGGE
jgi:hypothetical protein